MIIWKDFLIDAPLGVELKLPEEWKSESSIKDDTKDNALGSAYQSKEAKSEQQPARMVGEKGSGFNDKELTAGMPISSDLSLADKKGRVG